MRIMDRLPDIIEALDEGGALVIGRVPGGEIEITLYRGTIQVRYPEGQTTAETILTAPSVLALTQSIML